MLLSEFDLAVAVCAFLDLGRADNEIVRHSELAQILGVALSLPSMRKGLADQLDLVRLSRLHSLREVLLVDHNIDLASVPSEGYRIIPPAEQAQLARVAETAKARKALQRGVLRAKHVRMENLTWEQRRQATDVAVELARKLAAVQVRSPRWD